MGSRREFLRDVGCAGLALAASPMAFAEAANKAEAKNKKERELAPYEKDPVRLGFIGCGLMGGQNMRRALQLGQKITAVCDVDTGAYGFGNAKKYAPDAETFVDYREMLDKIKGKVDALVISTPDHSHFSIAMSSLNHGFPIYLEKPMCHTIYQIRELTKLSKQKALTTQMGNMVHSGDGIRITKEWIAAGAIGKVKEVVLWTCRPLSGCNERPGGFKQWPPADPIPETLDWDKWQNTATPATFTKRVVPLNWRRFFKYGSGSLGDIGCHMIDIPMYALGLGYPSRVTSRQRGGTHISVPLQDEVVYYFDSDNQGEKVKLTWYSGFLKPDKNGNWEPGYDKSFLPPLPEEFTKLGRGYKDLSMDGIFFMGSEGVIYSPTMHLMGKPVLLPKSRWDDIKDSIRQTEPRIKYTNHFLNFIEGVRSDIKNTTSNFSDMQPLTEVVQLGNLALQSGEDIYWDWEKMECKGSKRAKDFINPPMRSGWY